MKKLPVALKAILIALFFLQLNNAKALPKNKSLKLVTSSNLVSFNTGSVYLISKNRLLKIKFVRANPVPPRPGKAPFSKAGSALEKIFYDNLWNGISLVYKESDFGIVKSSFVVEPGANVNSINMSYNRAAEITKGGKLKFVFNSGILTQSKPVAWQVIKGKKNFVAVRFKQKGENEIGFEVGNYNKNFELIIDPTWEWNTFVGCSAEDQVKGIAVDDSGNIYAVGFSWCAWGNPVRAFSGNRDAFVVKLNNSGERVWNTFLGGSAIDVGEDIDLSDTTVVVVGYSGASWGSPVNAFTTNGQNAFVAKLNAADGTLIWNTFMGSDNTNYGSGIAVGPMNTIYVVGTSFTTWGLPFNAFAGGQDAFLAQVDADGNLNWNTFVGSDQTDYAYDVALDDALNAYVIGYSTATWGTPVHAYNGGTSDAFIAKFAYNGILIWNTFLGASDEDDRGYAIAVDDSFHVFAVGESENRWGSPIRAFGGVADAFVAKLNEDGDVLWNTFLGGDQSDYGYGIQLNQNGKLIICGSSMSSWGSPADVFNGQDAFVALLDGDGNLQNNTFLGGTSVDIAYSVAVDSLNNFYAGGYSQSTWGSPVDAYTGSKDGFVAKLKFTPVGVKVTESSSRHFKLFQNYPNPFNPATIIKYSIPALFGGKQNNSPLRVTLKIYDVLGREIRTLVNRAQKPGEYSVQFNASGLPSGVYFYKLSAGDFAAARKMILLK